MSVCLVMADKMATELNKQGRRGRKKEGRERERTGGKERKTERGADLLSKCIE